MWSARQNCSLQSRKRAVFIQGLLLVQGNSCFQMGTHIRMAEEIPADAREPNVQQSKVLSGCIRVQLAATQKLE